MRNFLFTLLCASVSAFAFAQTITPTSAEERLKGISKRKELEEKSLLKNVKFRNVGPTIMSGRAVDVEVNENNPNEFYVAYASGGLWYTNNNGQSFSPVFDKEDVITIGDVAVNWKQHSIWIGTGEANSSRSSYSGVGVYQSSDSGRTWNYKGLGESHHIGKILVHPSQPNTVFVAALGHLYSPNKDRGVYKTTDGGKTWKLVLFVDENTGAVDLAVDNSNPNVLYAAMWHRERRAWNLTEGGASTGIYKSVDGGETWTNITKDGSGFPRGDGLGRIGLALYPKNPNIIYAILDNQEHKKDEPKNDTSVLEVRDLKGISKEAFLAIEDKKLDAFLKSNDFPEMYKASIVKDLIKKDSLKVSSVTDYLNDANNALFDSSIIGAEVYRSDDAGKSWKKMNTGELFKLSYTYGYYFGKIFVSPQNENKVIICGVPLLLSKDSGKTFSSIDADNTHGDNHAVWFNPNNDAHIINCNDGGVNISYDDGKNWFKANTPSVGQFYSVAVDMDKTYNVYGGLQDNGVWSGPSNSNPNDKSWLQIGQYPFKFIYGGDGMQVQVDTRDNATVYTGFQFGYYARLNKNTGEEKGIHPKNKLGEANFRFNWQTPILLSRHNQDILYMGTNKFNRSMNKGDDMKTLSEDLTMNDKKGDVPFNTITTLSESPLRFGLIYVGTDDGLAWVSKDDGYTWKKISDKLPQGLYVSRISASNFKEGRVYISLNGYRNDHFNPYLFKSDDYGETWSAIDNGLPYEPINVVKEDVKNENLLFVGTDNGLYASLNQGKSYMTMNGDLPRVAVHDLIVHPRENELVLGTHGRSIYIAKLKEVQQLNDSLLQKPAYIFGLDAVTFNKNWGKKFDPFSPDTFQAKLTIPYYVKENGVSTIRIKYEKDLVLRTFTDSSEAGINYASYNIMIDSTTASSLQKAMSDKKKNKIVVIKKGEDNNYYLPAGKYTLDVTTQGKNIATADFEIKESKKDDNPSEEGKMKD
jgi:photosystem II stability/assembly factor-like uncharacterized protein